MWIIITCTTIITLTYVQAFACIGLALFPTIPFRTRIHSRPFPPQKSLNRDVLLPFVPSKIEMEIPNWY